METFKSGEIKSGEIKAGEEESKSTKRSRSNSGSHSDSDSEEPAPKRACLSAPATPATTAVETAPQFASKTVPLPETSEARLDELKRVFSKEYTKSNKPVPEEEHDCSDHIPPYADMQARMCTLCPLASRNMAEKCNDCAAKANAHKVEMFATVLRDTAMEILGEDGSADNPNFFMVCDECFKTQLLSWWTDIRGVYHAARSGKFEEARKIALGEHGETEDTRIIWEVADPSDVDDFYEVLNDRLRKPTEPAE